LSLFVGPFTLEAAAAVASGDGLGASETIEALDNLVAKSLIAPSGARPLRYRLLDMTRAYAVQKLEEAAEARLFARRYAEYLRALFDRADSDTSIQLSDWLSLYGAELDNVRAALDWTFSPEGDNTLGIALTAAAVTLWVRLSLFTECRERTKLALSKLDEGTDDDGRKRMQLLAALGWSLMYSDGRAREARPILEETLQLAERLDEKDFRLRALWGLCIDQLNNGELGRALEFANRFSSAAAGSSDDTDIMLSHRLLAVALHYLGDQTAARLHIDRVNASLHGLTEKPKTFPLDLRVSTQYFRIRILWLQGLADQAQALIARNIEEGRSNGHALTFCSVLGQGACPIAFLAGDLDAAERYGNDLLEHTERHSVRLWHLWARAFNATVTARRGNLERGLHLLREALDRAGDARFLPRFLPLLGELAAGFGEANQVHQGFEVIEQTLARCRVRQERWYVPELTRIKGELILKETQHSPSAEACFREALEIAAQQGARFWELRSAISLARFRIGQGRNAEAAETLRQVHGSFSEGFDIADMRTARGLIDQLRT
jgi:predicted ATPase